MARADQCPISGSDIYPFWFHLPENQISGKVSRMKTTLDIPNDLYRQAKAVAALEGLRMKDLISEGLRLTLEERRRGKSDVLEVFREIRARPLHASEAVAAIIEESDSRRREGWRRADTP